jgi:site-specific DNA recombinase
VERVEKAMNETIADTQRCVIYARVSTKAQAEEEIPIQGQIKECELFAQSRGWQVVQVYQDAGFSGGTVDRPAFQSMLSDANKKPRPFDIILTWRTNRLFRNLEMRLTYTRVLGYADVKIVSLNEPSLEGSNGRLVEHVMGAFDEHLRSQISEDTLRGMKLVARNGFSTGGIPPRGYRNDRRETGNTKANGDKEMRTVWVPDDVWAPKVLIAFQMYEEGKTLAEIAAVTHITAAKNGLSTLLRNRAYLGLRIYNATRRASLQDKKYKRIKNKQDDVIIIQGAHSPIVPLDLFNRVQTILDQRRPKIGQRKQSPNNYVLSGILWCKEHDVPYTGHTTGDTFYYACSLRKKLGKEAVPCAWLKKEKAESFVISTLKTKIFTFQTIREGLEHLQKEAAIARQQDDSEMKETTVQITETELKISRLIKAISQGVDAATVQVAINDFSRELKNLRNRLAHLEKERDRAMRLPAITDAAVADVMLKLQNMLETTDPQELKSILSHFIEKIEIAGDNATFFYTFGEIKKEIVPSNGDPEGI